MATTKRNTNEITEAKVKQEVTRYTPEEIANMIVNLLITRNNNGDILVANVIEDESIVNNCKFVKAIMVFIDSVSTGNSYDAVSSLTEICTNPRYADGLDQICAYLRSSNSDFAYWLKNCLSQSQNWKFNDALLNTLWTMKTFHRAAAIILYGMVSYLSDVCFNSIEINGYFGDTAGLGAITENCSVFFRDNWDN